MYPEKQIFDVAGFPQIRGRELVNNLLAQAAPFNPEYLLGVRAETLTYEGELPVLGLSNHEPLRCKSVLITGGIGSFSPRRLPAADAFSGEGVIYFVRELDSLAQQDVLIVGGGDSAFDWALALSPIAKSVTL